MDFIPARLCLSLLVLLLCSLPETVPAQGMDAIAQDLLRDPKSINCGVPGPAASLSMTHRGDGAGRVEFVVIRVPRQCALMRATAVDAVQTNESFSANISSDRVVGVSGAYSRRDSSRSVGRSPQGLLVTGGTQVFPVHRFPHGQGGFVAQTEAGVRILPFSIADKTGFKEALQSMPLLVENDADGIVTDRAGPSSRLCVVVDGAGDVAVVGVFGRLDKEGVSLAQFSQLILSLGKASGMRGIWAINLDGGPAARLHIPQLKLSFGVGRPYYMASMLTFGR